MFPEDSCLWVYGVGEDGVPAFTRNGIDNLRHIIVEERAAGRAPTSTEAPEIAWPAVATAWKRMSASQSVVDQDVDLSKLIGGLATVAAHPNRRGHSPGRLLHGRGYFTFISTATFARAVRSRATSSKSVRMRSTRGRITFLGRGLLP
jgi:hypothetical protein